MRSIDSPLRPWAVSSRWPGSRGNSELIVFWMVSAREWLGVARRSFSGMSFRRLPPSSTRPLVRLMVSRLVAFGSTKGLITIDPPPSASGAGCRLPVKSGPGRRSATSSRPPSRLVVEVPGAMMTRTSNFECFEAPGGMTPSTTTTALSSEFRRSCGDRGGVPGWPLPNPRLASSCERNARTSAGICRLPVPRRPTTMP